MAKARTRIIDLGLESRKRVLRRDIGRGRRQLEQHVAAVAHEGRRLISWRTYVRRFPGLAAAGAFGLGLALSAGITRRSIKRRLGKRIVASMLGLAKARLWPEIAAFWAETSPTRRDPAGHP